MNQRPGERISEFIVRINDLLLQLEPNISDTDQIHHIQDGLLEEYKEWLRDKRPFDSIEELEASCTEMEEKNLNTKNNQLWFGQRPDSLVKLTSEGLRDAICSYVEHLHIDWKNVTVPAKEIDAQYEYSALMDWAERLADEGWEVLQNAAAISKLKVAEHCNSSDIEWAFQVQKDGPDQFFRRLGRKNRRASSSSNGNVNDEERN